VNSINDHKADDGVASNGRVLTEHGYTIAPSTY
jgi:hypothetical protein